MALGFALFAGTTSTIAWRVASRSTTRSSNAMPLDLPLASSPMVTPSRLVFRGARGMVVVAAGARSVGSRIRVMSAPPW